MDANEHIYRKSLGRILTNPAGLAMSEVVGDFTGEQLGATYFRGSKPIDAVWATTDLTVVGACAMPCGYGAGDHQLFVVDFLLSSMVGMAPTKNHPPWSTATEHKDPECGGEVHCIFRPLNYQAQANRENGEGPREQPGGSVEDPRTEQD